MLGEIEYLCGWLNRRDWAMRIRAMMSWNGYAYEYTYDMTSFQKVYVVLHRGYCRSQSTLWCCGRPRGLIVSRGPICMVV